MTTTSDGTPMSKTPNELKALSPGDNLGTHCPGVRGSRGCRIGIRELKDRGRVIFHDSNSAKEKWKASVLSDRTEALQKTRESNRLVQQGGDALLSLGSCKVL